MGKCTICGQPAGFLTSLHSSCVDKQKKSQNDIQALFLETLNDSSQIGFLRGRTEQIATEGKLTAKIALQTVIDSIGQVIDAALADQMLTITKENTIVQIRKTFEDFFDPIQTKAGNERLIKAAIIRDLQSGQPISCVAFNGHLPILLEKTENIVWAFLSTNYYEMKLRTQYIGRSRGASVRIMKGVYFRVGEHKGERIQTSQTQLADTGLFVITDKNVHFKGALKSFRIPIKKLISVDLNSDGITIFKDSADPKPQFFAVDDPQFAANALSLLC